jgi:hypothetical protein
VRRSWGLLVLSAALVGCALFSDYGEDPAAEPATGGDGGITTDGTSPDDALADSPLSVQMDGGVDGARFCANDAGQIFCADFDVGDVDDGWTALSGGTVGSVSADGMIFFSPPRSLLSTAPASPDYLQAAHLRKLLTGGFTTFSCAFMVRRDQVSAATATFAALEVYYGNNDQYLASASFTDVDGELLVNRYVDGGTNATKSAAPLAFALGAWHEVRIEATTTQARLHVDGTLRATIVHQFATAPLSAELFLGLSEITTGSNSAWAVHYDDVRCFRTP